MTMSVKIPKARRKSQKRHTYHRTTRININPNDYYNPVMDYYNPLIDYYNPIIDYYNLLLRFQPFLNLLGLILILCKININLINININTFLDSFALVLLWSCFGLNKLSRQSRQSCSVSVIKAVYLNIHGNFISIILEININPDDIINNNLVLSICCCALIYYWIIIIY